MHKLSQKKRSLAQTRAHNMHACIHALHWHSLTTALEDSEIYLVTVSVAGLEDIFRTILIL